MEEQKDYSGYTYASDAKVVVSGVTFNYINNLLNKLSQEEIKIFTELVKDQEPVPKIFRTDKGEAMHQGLEMLFEAHMENVDSGVATLREELERPKVTLETA